MQIQGIGKADTKGQKICSLFFFKSLFRLPRLARDVFTYLQTLWVQRIPNSGRYEAIDQRHQKWLRLWSRHHLSACQEQSFNFSFTIRSRTNSKLRQGYPFFRCVFLHLWIACWNKHELVEFQREHRFWLKGKNWKFLMIHQKIFL